MMDGIISSRGVRVLRRSGFTFIWARFCKPFNSRRLSLLTQTSVCFLTGAASVLAGVMGSNALMRVLGLNLFLCFCGWSASACVVSGALELQETWLPSHRISRVVIP
jgi:hypothetical protein